MRKHMNGGCPRLKISIRVMVQFNGHPPFISYHSKSYILGASLMPVLTTYYVHFLYWNCHFQFGVGNSYYWHYDLLLFIIFYNIVHAFIFGCQEFLKLLHVSSHFIYEGPRCSSGGFSKSANNSKVFQFYLHILFVVVDPTCMSADLLL